MAEEIDVWLRENRPDSPLIGQGETFVPYGVKYGIDPRLVPAISGIESSFATDMFRPHNAWGWGGHDFESFDEAIETVTTGLREIYIDEGLHSVQAISEKYCPIGAENDPNGTNHLWPGRVTDYFSAMGGNIDDVRLKD